MESKVYNQEGKESGKITLPERVFGLPWNGDLVHQVAVSMMSNARTPIAHTKNRGEVSGGGKKPWQQKGTGRARHGSIRSPLWVGGGVTHGPRNDKNFTRKINKKMKAKALFTILSKKHKDGEVLFIDSVILPETKTKEAVKILKNLSAISGFEKISKKRSNALYVAFPKNEVAKVKRGFANIGNVAVDSIENINPLDLLKYTYLAIISPETSFTFLEGKLNKSRNNHKISSFLKSNNV